MESKRNEIVVIGVVYPGVEGFLDDYLHSLEIQTCNQFDLLLANDNMTGLNNYLNNTNLNTLTHQVNGSVSGNRRLVINKALGMGYKKFIFTDVDDSFEKNRIEVVSNLLDEDSIIVNDLDITDVSGQIQTKRYLLNRFNESEIIKESTLLNGNMMGLSNTAARAEILQNSCALKTGDTMAFDWYLWSSVLMKKNNARFTAKTSTRYRIYNNNMAGLPQHPDRDNVMQGVNVKLKHYQLMSQQDSKYIKLADQYQILDNRLKDQDYLIKYIGELNKHAIDYPLWWENIRLPSEIVH